MDEQALDLQIKEGQATVERAGKLVAEHKALYEKVGIGEDLFSEVLAHDQFTEEFKNIVKEERAKAVAKIESQIQKHTPGKSSKIAGHAGVTKI